jgi:hypothetical protein
MPPLPMKCGMSPIAHNGTNSTCINAPHQIFQQSQETPLKQNIKSKESEPSAQRPGSVVMTGKKFPPPKMCLSDFLLRGVSGAQLKIEAARWATWCAAPPM